MSSTRILSVLVGAALCLTVLSGCESKPWVAAADQYLDALRANDFAKAYGMLEREGLLERRRGIGLFVSDRTQRDQARSRLSMLESAMKDAAILAVQLGVSKEQAMDLFARFHGQFNSRGTDQT